MKDAEKAFLWSLVALSVYLAFLHFNILPYIGWRGPDGTVYLAWRALVAAWPIWITSGTAAVAVGLSSGRLIRKSVTEREAVSEAERYRSLALQAQQDAASAKRTAEAALASDREALEKREAEVCRVSRHAEEAIGQTQLLQAQIQDLQSLVDYQHKKIGSLQRNQRPRRSGGSSYLPFK